MEISVVNVGDTDRQGNVDTEQGWYYKWYRGIHLLCGEEGLDRYKHANNNCTLFQVNLVLFVPCCYRLLTI